MLLSTIAVFLVMISIKAIPIFVAYGFLGDHLSIVYKFKGVLS